MSAAIKLSGLYDVAPNDCWLWRGQPDRGGYGRISRGGRKVKAHRYSWALANGPIPIRATPSPTVAPLPSGAAVGTSEPPSLAAQTLALVESWALRTRERT